MKHITKTTLAVLIKSFSNISVRLLKLFIKAHFNCIEDLLERDWQYFINLCANDFPIKTSKEMATSLKELYPKNRISSRPIKEDETSRLNRYRYSWKIAVNDHPTPSDDYPMHQINTGRALKS